MAGISALIGILAVMVVTILAADIISLTGPGSFVDTFAGLSWLSSLRDRTSTRMVAAITSDSNGDQDHEDKEEADDF
jgi:hypothetical protein